MIFVDENCGCCRWLSKVEGFYDFSGVTARSWCQLFRNKNTFQTKIGNN